MGYEKKVKRKFTILLVEDNAADIRLTEEIINQSKIIETRNGLSANGRYSTKLIHH